MQSGRRAVPEVMEPMAIADACDLFAQAGAVLVFWEEAPRAARIADALSRFLVQGPPAPAEVCVAVVVGPEGGLTQGEVDTFLARCEHASVVSLGSSILRTETAGIVAPALVLYELGGLGNTLSSKRNEFADIGAFRDDATLLGARPERGDRP